MFDDDYCRLGIFAFQLLRQLPAGFEIDEIVEAEFLALELCCTGDAEAGAVRIESGALMGVFAVTQGLSQRKVDAQRPRQTSCV